MQTKLTRGQAAFRMRRVGLSVAILTALPLTAALMVPNQAFAGCGVNHSTGVHTASSTASTGVHAATSGSAASGSGGTTSGCSTGTNTSAVSGLATTGSGRVVETGAHAARTENHVRTAATRTANTAAHFHAFGAGGHRV
jgi:hypothetical protein